MRKIAHFHNWLEVLPEPIKSEILARYHSRKIEDGGLFYRSNDPANASFLIYSGRVKVCSYSSDGKELIIGHLYSGDTFGDMGCIDNENRSNFAIAVGSTEYGILDKEDFNYFYEKHIEVAHSINNLFTRRLRQVFTLIEDATMLPLRARLARLLSRMANSVGVDIGSDQIDISDISQEDIGRLLGASRQSISRELKKFESEDVIKIHYSKITILDIRFLNEFDLVTGHETEIPDYENLFGQRK